VTVFVIIGDNTVEKQSDKSIDAVWSDIMSNNIIARNLLK